MELGAGDTLASLLRAPRSDGRPRSRSPRGASGVTLTTGGAGRADGSGDPTADRGRALPRGAESDAGAPVDHPPAGGPNAMPDRGVVLPTAEGIEDAPVHTTMVQPGLGTTSLESVDVGVSNDAHAGMQTSEVRPEVDPGQALPRGMVAPEPAVCPEADLRQARDAGGDAADPLVCFLLVSLRYLRVHMEMGTPLLELLTILGVQLVFYLFVVWLRLLKGVPLCLLPWVCLVLMCFRLVLKTMG